MGVLLVTGCSRTDPPVPGLAHAALSPTPSLRLVKDLNPSAHYANQLQNLSRFRDGAFFSAYADGNGYYLWFTDGTTEGTRVVGPAGTPKPLVTMRDWALFVARIGGSDFVVRTDGTFEGTVPLANAVATWAAISVGERAYFLATHDGGNYLVSTDGTVEGTIDLARIGAAGSPQPLGLSLTYAGGRFYLVEGGSLWTSDGTGPGTMAIHSIDLAGDERLVAAGDKVVFVARDDTGSEPWVSDGTSEGTARLADLAPGTASSSPTALTVYRRSVVFLASTSDPCRLWITDGSSAGTRRMDEVCAIAPGTPSGLQVWGDRLVFATGNKLWSTDGTGPGTQLLVGPTAPRSLGFSTVTPCDRGLFFFVTTSLPSDSSSSETALWISDATAGGTHAVEPLQAPGLRATGCAGDRFLFEDDATSTLWIADGVPGGTRLLRDFTVDSGGWPQAALEVSGKVIFEDQGNPISLWQTDGTTEGTTPIVSLPYGVTPGPLVPSAHGLLFPASQYSGRGLWRTDLTQNGTGPLLASTSAYNLTPLDGGLVLYTAYDGVSAMQLFVTDGTDAGTRGLPASGAGSSFDGPLPAFGTGVALFARTADAGSELWTSDGSPAGTHQVVDAEPGPANGISFGVRVANGLAFFANGAAGQIVRSDGTPEGTFPVAAISHFSDPVVLEAASDTVWFTTLNQFGTLQRELWVSDGGIEGTRAIYSSAQAVSALVPFEALMLFGVTGPSGPETWRSDGTIEGTFKLADLELGAERSDFLVLEPEQRLVFAATDPRHGKELWITNGLPEGTRRVTDIAQGPLSSFPKPLIRFGPDLLFAANDGFLSSELWAASVAFLLDEVPPVLECPDVEVEAQGPDGGSASNRVTARDAVTASPEIEVQPAAGVLLPFGTTPASASATDEAGNRGTCQFQIRVADTTAPALACPSDFSAELPAGADAVPITFPVEATDLVGPVTVAVSPPSGSAFSVGTTTVTASANDGAGNSSACTFRITVVAAAEADSGTSTGVDAGESADGGVDSRPGDAGSLPDDADGGAATSLPDGGDTLEPAVPGCGCGTPGLADGALWAGALVLCGLRRRKRPHGGA